MKPGQGEQSKRYRHLITFEVTAMIALLNSFIKTVRSGSSVRRVALNYGRILLRNIRTRGHDGFVFM